MDTPDPAIKRLSSYLLAILFACMLVNTDCLADKGSGESANGSLTSNPPDTVVLFSPENLLADAPVDLTLTWYPQVHTSSYHFHLTGTSGSTSLKLESLNNKDTLFEATGLFYSTTFYWRVRAENIAGEGAWSEVWSFTTSADPTLGISRENDPQTDQWVSVFPNPFNHQITIRIDDTDNHDLSLIILNSSGMIVRKILDPYCRDGVYEITWDGSDQQGIKVAEGLYLVVIRTGNRTVCRKIMKTG